MMYRFMSLMKGGKMCHKICFKWLVIHPPVVWERQGQKKFLDIVLSKVHQKRNLCNHFISLPGILIHQLYWILQCLMI